jgi:hypothetical protein
METGLGCCALAALCGEATATDSAQPDEEIATMKMEKEFVQNFLADLLETMESELDRETRVKLIEGCGRACYNRFQFKKEIAIQGEGDLQKLLAAYNKNFEVWQEGNAVHIRHGEVSKGCYCPAARYRPAKACDLHCESTRTTHQTIFETALKRPFEVDILESLRRGGKTCHFLVHLA